MDTARATPPARSSEEKFLGFLEIVDETAISQHAYESSLPMNEVNRLLLESVADGIYATDAKGRTTFINPAAIRMTGWTAEEVVGKPDNVFARHLRPRARIDLPNLFPNTLELAPAQGEDNSIFWRKDGSSFPASCTGTSVLRHGKLLGTVVIFRDISESRRMEKWEQSKNAIFSAIIAHHSLPSTMQLMADAFVALYPPKSIAIFVLAGDQFHIEAEAGLPLRAVPPAAPASLALERLQESSLGQPRDDPRAWLGPPIPDPVMAPPPTAPHSGKY